MQRSLLLLITLLSTLTLVLAPEASGRPLGAWQGPGTAAAECDCPLGMSTTPMVNPPPCVGQVSLLWDYIAPGWCSVGECALPEPCGAIVRVRLLSRSLPGCNWLVIDPNGRAHTGTGNYVTPPIGVLLGCGDYAPINIFADSSWVGALIVICNFCEATKN